MSRYPNPTRTKARQRALDLLFEADVRESHPLDVMAEHVARAEPPVRDFTIELIEGVVREIGPIDNLIRKCLSADWDLRRMPRIDRNLCRIAIYEMWWTDTPPTVAVDQAVTLAGRLSTDESPAFVNGVLGKALEFHRAEQRAKAAAEPAPETSSAEAAEPTASPSPTRRARPSRAQRVPVRKSRSLRRVRLRSR